MKGGKNINSAALTLFVKDLELKGVTILITASLIIPFIIHLIPTGKRHSIGCSAASDVLCAVNSSNFL